VPHHYIQAFERRVHQLNPSALVLTDPSVGTLVKVQSPHARMKGQYVLCVAGGVACAYWLPGWWKLGSVPLVWWGLAGLGLMPSFDVTPVVNVINCAAPTLKALGGLLK
jgi:hypothetical protein